MKSVRSKILAFAIVATLVPSIGLGLLSFWRYQDLIRDKAGIELRMLADHTGGELELWVQERVDELRAIAASRTMIDVLSARATAPGGASRSGTHELELVLRAAQKKRDPLLELTVADAAGRTVAGSAANRAPVRLPTEWPGAAVTQGAVPEPPQWDPARATATLTVVVPVMSHRNELLGALSAVLDLGAVQSRLEHVVNASPAEVILLAPNGAPLFSTHGLISELASVDAAALARLRAHPGEPVIYAGHHQRPVVGVADRTRSLPIVVVAEIDRADVYRNWLRTLQVFLALVGGLTLAVGILAYGIGHSIVRPLDSLIGAADRIASGDLAVPLQAANGGEIGELSRVFNKMVERLRRGREDLETANRALQEQNKLLEALAVTDSLTGLFNRKKLDDILDDQFVRFRRNQRPFALLMVDIDKFKLLNDTHGHLAGDEVLVALAGILQRSVRAVDFVARYGGEEFVVVLVETTTKAAAQIAERIRALVESHRPEATREALAITVSIGVTESHATDGSVEDVLARADHAMYDAKHAGRNAVREA